MIERLAPSLFVGIGSPHGNDRLGWVIADELEKRLAERAGVIDVRNAKSPADLLDWLDGRERLFLCDACRMHTEAGTIHCWQWPHAEISHTLTGGSHDWNLTAVLELANRLGRLPSRVLVWGVEIGEDPIQPKITLSPSLQACIPDIVARIISDLQELPS